jgi:YggT family protein
MSLALLNLSQFLINTLFGIYILAVMLRFLLQWVKADFYNPMCQMLIKLTNPPLLPLRKVIPGWFGLDFAGVVLMLILQCIELALLSLLFHYPINSWLVVIGVVKLMQLVLNLYFFAIILRALLSWFSPNPTHPNVILLYQLTEPALKPVRRLLPPISGIDLSPLLLLIVLQVASIGLNAFIGT